MDTSELLESLFDAIPDVIGIQDRHHGIIRYNSAGYKFLNMTHKETEGKKCYELIGRSTPCDICATTECYKTKKPTRVEKYVEEMNVWLDVRAYPILDENGEIVKVIEHLRDITERKQTEESLVQAKLVIENSPAVLFRWKAAKGWPVELASKNVAQFGYRPEELLSGEVPYASLVHPDDLERVAHEVRRCSASGVERFQQEYRIITKDGKVCWVDDRTVIERDADGQITHYQGIVIDITKRKRAEKALRKAHNELERRVEERTAELVKAVASLRKEIEERKQAEEALRKSYTEVEQLKDRLQSEGEYLRAEIKLAHSHEEIVGKSEAIKKVFLQIEQVAPTESSVLITGETGTGKELVARAIHNLSKRKDRVMVKVDCASLPSTLVESELFGRQKGAYTGALTSQVGRFEVADGSSIFLDEIGELLPELQVKLLRVLQEGEFERLGSPKTIRVNVRVIAATNRDLSAEVRKGNFREDLYYRLNVFHIEVPPLRERLDDIPLLVWTFANEFAEKMGKKIQTVPKRTMEALQRYHWPGNVRELRNVIEHAVIVSTSDMLKVKLPQDPRGVTSRILTLKDAERQHITKVLERTNWRIKGPHGAAELLGLKPSTLYTRMNKLGIPTGRNKDAIPT